MATGRKRATKMAGGTGSCCHRSPLGERHDIRVLPGMLQRRLKPSPEGSFLLQPIIAVSAAERHRCIPTEQAPAVATPRKSSCSAQGGGSNPDCDGLAFACMTARPFAAGACTTMGG